MTDNLDQSNTQTPTKHNKTPEYTLRAIKAYQKRNPELTKQRSHQKYLQLTPEQRNTYNNNRKIARANMTQEQRDAYNAKQRAYYQQRKKLLSKNDITTELPLHTLNLNNN